MSPTLVVRMGHFRKIWAIRPDPCLFQITAEYYEMDETLGKHSIDPVDVEKLKKNVANPI